MEFEKNKGSTDEIVGSFTEDRATTQNNLSKAFTDRKSVV